MRDEGAVYRPPREAEAYVRQATIGGSCNACTCWTNHASNSAPIAGTLPADRDQLPAVIDTAIDGRLPLRPEPARGL